MDSQNIKIGVAIIVKRNDQILLGKRSGTAAGPDQWGVPGGHLELNELMSVAAKRELLEETGLTVESLKFIALVGDARLDNHYVNVVFESVGVVGDPAVMETDKCSEWGWFNINDLPEPIFFGHAKLLKAVLENKVFTD